MPSGAHTDSCPDCGEHLTPVLDPTPTPPESGLLGHDSPVHLRCPACGRDV